MKFHFLRITSALALLGISVCAYAQVTFEKGYYIDNQNRRFDCLIRFVDEKNNPERFDYKASEQSSVQSLSKNEVSEFAIEGLARFVRREVDIDRSSTETAQLTYDRTPVFTREVLFLRVLVGGEASLYGYKQGLVEKYFYSTGNGPVEALVFKKFKTRDNQVASNFRFRQQLLNGLTCDGFAEKQFGQLTYGERSLVGLFEEYNKCKNAAYTVYDASRKREAFHLAIRPRVSYSSAKATLTTYQIGFETSFDPQLQYGIGVNLEYVLPFNRNKWAFMMEPVLNQPYKQKVPINNIHLRGRDLFLEMNYAPIDLFLGIRYYIFLNDNTRLFLNVGYVKGFKRKSRMEYTGEGTAIGYSTAWIGTTLQNLDVGAGVKFARRFSLEARYNTVRSANGGLLYWDIPYKSASFVLGVDVF